MKCFLSLLALVGFSTCFLSSAKADTTEDRQTNGTATLYVTGHLSSYAPYTTYYTAPPPGSTVSVQVDSVHYAEYYNLFAVSGVSLHWYFRSGVIQEQVDQGTEVVTLAVGDTWRKSKSLTGTYGLPASHCNAVASSTLNDGGAFPYASDTRPFDVYVGYAGP